MKTTLTESSTDGSNRISRPSPFSSSRRQRFPKSKKRHSFSETLPDASSCSLYSNPGGALCSSRVFSSVFGARVPSLKTPQLFTILIVLFTKSHCLLLLLHTQNAPCPRHPVSSSYVFICSPLFGRKNEGKSVEVVVIIIINS